MKTPGLLLVVALSFLLATPLMVAQVKVFHTFDAGAGQWTVGVQPGTTNSLTLTDYPDESTEGTGSMLVNAALRNFAASWGTWTDAQWTFPTPENLAGYDDIRFDMKIVTPPSHVGAKISGSRALQFVIDIYDSVYHNGTGSVVLWRYTAGTGDFNIFYYPHKNGWLSPSQPGWFEVVIPFSALRYPNWYSPLADSVLHLNNVVRVAFGVDGDSSAADSVSFLIDNLRATTKQRVTALQAMDGPASAWVVGSQPGADIKAIATDYPDDYIEGSGSMFVDVALRTQAAGWGSWTDFRYNFPTPMDATGATELRFSYKTITPSLTSKRLQFVVDLYDSSSAGPEGPWRWADGFGQFGLWAAGLENNFQKTWTEVAIPLRDLSLPSWVAPTDSALNLNMITALAFGVDADSSGVDSVQFLLDDFHFTRLGGTVGVDEYAVNGVPAEFKLEQNYPNPFNPSTNVSFTLMQQGKVSLKIYNLTGQLVATLLDNVEHAAGRYQVRADMSQFASGVYFYVLQQGPKREARTMVLLK